MTSAYMEYDGETGKAKAWGDVFLEQDFADAACISLYGLKESRDGDS